MTRLHKDPLPRKDASREALARFWDMHDLADYADELKPVQVHFGKKFSEPITVRLDRETLQTLRQEANKKGIGATTLIRMWVYEQVNHLRQAHA